MSNRAVYIAALVIIVPCVLVAIFLLAQEAVISFNLSNAGGFSGPIILVVPFWLAPIVLLGFYLRELIRFTHLVADNKMRKRTV